MDKKGKIHLAYCPICKGIYYTNCALPTKVTKSIRGKEIPIRMCSAHKTK